MYFFFVSLHCVPKCFFYRKEALGHADMKHFLMVGVFIQLFCAFPFALHSHSSERAVSKPDVTRFISDPRVKKKKAWLAMKNIKMSEMGWSLDINFSGSTFTVLCQVSLTACSVQSCMSCSTCDAAQTDIAVANNKNTYFLNSIYI